MTTATAIETTETTTITETTNMTEATRPDAESGAESPRPVAQAHPGPEAGTSFLPSATPGAITLNWK